MFFSSSHSTITKRFRPSISWIRRTRKTSVHVVPSSSRVERVQGIVWHGLRATAASWLAEMGCTEREIMSITGHATAASVSVYVRHAEQKTHAVNAIAKFSARALDAREKARGVTSVFEKGEIK
ncbi:hypothetical protein CXP35_04525 [Komagataeibacter xylinus]|nr:hypothetical protein CXP35_04525 [Komagataeibacter xylinus]